MSQTIVVPDAATVDSVRLEIVVDPGLLVTLSTGGASATRTSVFVFGPLVFDLAELAGQEAAGPWTLTVTSPDADSSGGFLTRWALDIFGR